MIGNTTTPFNYQKMLTLLITISTNYPAKNSTMACTTPFNQTINGTTFVGQAITDMTNVPAPA